MIFRSMTLAPRIGPQNFESQNSNMCLQDFLEGFSFREEFLGEGEKVASVWRLALQVPVPV